MLPEGTLVAGYEIDGVLGEGGMGVVYRATQVSLKRTVALKVLVPGLAEDDSFVERFRRECLIQAGLDHPHIVTVFEAGESEHGLFLAMRYVKGCTLKELIIDRSLDPRRLVRILTPVADALDAAHEAGLIHRDVKPQNILVGSRDHAYLADFGLTKAQQDPGLTQQGQFVGTLDYMSPEQIEAKPPVPQTDVYAFAAVLYEGITGSVPYPKASDVAVMFAHMIDPPPVVTERRPDLPTELDAAIAKGMAKDPDERHESVTDLVEDVARALAERPKAAVEAPAPATSPLETGFRKAITPEQAKAAAASAEPDRRLTLAPSLATPPGLQRLRPPPEPGTAPPSEEQGSGILTPSIHQRPVNLKRPDSRPAQSTKAPETKISPVKPPEEG